MTEAAGGRSLVWSEKVVIWMAIMPITLLVAPISPVLPKIQEAYASVPNAAFLVKMVIGINGFAMAIGCPAGGWLANRFNHRWLAFGAMSIFAIGGSLALVVPDLPTLLVTRFVTAFAGAVAPTVVLVMLSERTTGRARDGLFGIVVGIATVTNVVMSPIGGLLGHISWRLPFLLSLVMVAPAIACLFIPDVRSEARAAAPAPGRPFHMPLPPSLLIMALGSGLLLFLPYMYVPFHFSKIGIDDPRMISLSFALAAVIGGIGSGIYGWARRKLEIEQALMLSFVVIALGITGVAFSTTGAGAIAGMFVVGAGQAFTAPSIYALLALLPERDRAPAFGLGKGALYVSMLIGAVALEPIDKAFGADGVLLTIALLGLVMIVYAFAVRGRMGGPRDTQAAGAAVTR